MNQLLHDAADAGELFEGVGQLVLRNASHGGLQLVQHQLHPQLAGLVLHDEQHLVVVGRERLLRVQDGVELQVVAVAHAVIKVELGFFIVNDALAWRCAGAGTGRVGGAGERAGTHGGAFRSRRSCAQSGHPATRHCA